MMSPLEANILLLLLKSDQNIWHTQI